MILLPKVPRGKALDSFLDYRIFEQRQLDSRLKELSTVEFWNTQPIEVLKGKYKQAGVPGHYRSSSILQIEKADKDI